MSFAQQLAAFLDAAKAKLEAEGHTVAQNVEERIQTLKPLLEQDAAAAEAEALAFVKQLFVGDDE